jgi:hypothetical protein
MEQGFLAGQVSEDELKEHYRSNFEAGLTGLPLPPIVQGTRWLVRGGLAAKGGSELTRVGRWMSKAEYDTMSATGRVVEGAGGRTYVIRPPNPASYTGARPGSVYAEFNVPSGVLKPGSKPDWAVIPGPNVTTRIYGPAPAEMPPATCIVCVIGGQ